MGKVRRKSSSAMAVRAALERRSYNWVWGNPVVILNSFIILFVDGENRTDIEPSLAGWRNHFLVSYDRINRQNNTKASRK